MGARCSRLTAGRESSPRATAKMRGLRRQSGGVNALCATSSGSIPMALIVHKYGGTSMGSPERIRSVAKRVAKWARAGHQMVVVPSAMSGETNRLLGLAKELSPEHSTPELQIGRAHV